MNVCAHDLKMTSSDVKADDSNTDHLFAEKDAALPVDHQVAVLPQHCRNVHFSAFLLNSFKKKFLYLLIFPNVTLNFRGFSTQVSFLKSPSCSSAMLLERQRKQEVCFIHAGCELVQNTSAVAHVSDRRSLHL